MLHNNTTAPDFSLPDEKGVIHTLQSYAGTWLVVYFYPKDDTPGCTTEACQIGELYNSFSELGVTVIGVSKDTSESHQKFKEKYKLPFTLLSDESAEMIRAYGALKEKVLLGIKSFSTSRVTYIINPEGIVVKAYDSVTPAEHAFELLKDLQTLQFK